VTTKIEVRVDAMALAGRDDKPGNLTGYGPLTAEHARELAFDPDSVWYRILTDPLSGIVVDHGRTRYRPPAGLRDKINARDQRCTFIDCYTPATSCELDHNTPYPQGTTSEKQPHRQMQISPSLQRPRLDLTPIRTRMHDLDQPHRTEIRHHSRHRQEASRATGRTPRGTTTFLNDCGVATLGRGCWTPGTPPRLVC